MTLTNPTGRLARGEVWWVDFDPSKGDEIRKRRPAVIMSEWGIYRLGLVIVVPVTSWQDKFASRFWMIELQPNSGNGLANPSAADAFQVKSVSQERFVEKLGRLTPLQLDEIAAAIALCVGYAP